MALLVLLLVNTMAYAITQEQLEDAAMVISQIRQGLARMAYYVEIARLGKLGEVNLTPDQKTALVNAYVAKKAEIQALYQQLP
jgi:hypothetical protein